MNKNFTIILTLFSAIILHAQESLDTLENINKSFQSFEYENVIAKADSLLITDTTISAPLKLELYRMKGISHFSLLQNDLAANSFIEILKTDSTYKLDSAKTSPKIIDFFNRTKKEYFAFLTELKVSPASDTIFVEKYLPDPEAESRIKNAIIRSLVLPGLGHLYKEESLKGWLLTALSGISLVSSVYFAVDSDSKYDEYVTEKDFNAIEAKYDSYNTSYKLRNYSIIAFAAVWLYSQLDLLLFSDSSSINTYGSQDGLSLLYGGSLRLSINIPF